MGRPRITLVLLAAALTVLATSARSAGQDVPPASGPPASQADAVTQNQFADRTDAAALYREAMASEVGKQLDELLSRMVMDPSIQRFEVARILASHSESEVHAAIGAMERAAQLDFKQAQRTLGLWCVAGIWGKPDIGVGISLLTQAADQGDIEAQFLVGHAYSGYWFDIDPDHERAFAMLQQAADAEHAWATYLLGNAYRWGLGVEPDSEHAVRLWRRAADAGVTDARLELALAVERGDGTASDPEEAVRLMREAARDGNAEAQFQLARILLTDKEPTTKVAETVEWLEMAAEQDHMGATMALALLHDDGEFLERDEMRAIEYYRRAASPHALFDQTRYDQLSRRNPDRAAKYLERFGGMPRAQYRLGRHYWDNDSDMNDRREAIRLFERAAARGWPQAQYHLGYLYDNGLEVPQNDAEAMRWYSAAAEQGNTSAQYALGLLLMNGRGAQRDDVQAHKWLNLAGAAGSEAAQSVRNQIARRMTREQIAEAQRLAAEFVAKREVESSRSK